jgi:hypothetical protein
MTMTLPTGVAETVEHVLAVLRTPGVPPEEILSSTAGSAL